MTEKRFVLERSDYDLKYEFRVADTSKVKKTKEDFWNEEEEIYEYRKYIAYLWENDAFLTLEEADELLNTIHEKNEQLKHDATVLICSNQEYRKENEQLKQEYQKLEHRHSLLHDECLDIECERNSLKKDVESLEKENEQLKRQIGNLEHTKDFCEEVCADCERLEKENEQLKKENKELRQDNDIKFWKLQCIESSNDNQIMLFELGRVMKQGYEVSDKFKQYFGEIKEHNKEIQEKHKRLFE